MTQSAVVHDGLACIGVASNQESLASQADFTCCDFRGKLVALDQDDGVLKRQKYTTPEHTSSYSGVSVWGSTAVVDTTCRRIDITTGNNYTASASVRECAEQCGGCNKEQLRARLTQDRDNLVDAIVALDLGTSEVLWVRHHACFADNKNPANCPQPPGNDYDFGQGAALFTVNSGGRMLQILGAAEKSGVYYALNPDTGQVIWETQVGPGGVLGGAAWGSATDGERVDVAISNSDLKPWTLKGQGSQAGKTVTRGFWSAPDAALVTSFGRRLSLISRRHMRIP